MKTDSEFWIILADLIKDDRLALENISEDYVENMSENEKMSLEVFISAVNEKLHELFECQGIVEEMESENRF